MRARYIALLLFSGLLACVSPAPAVSKKAKDVTTPSQLHATSDDRVSVPKRMLRTYNTATDGIEERGIVTSLIKEGAASAANAAMLKTWLHRGKSAAEVLVKLKLNERVDDALASPSLKTLSKYLDMFNKKHPGAEVSLLGTLTARYGDDVVAKALVTAKRADPSKEIASKLQRQQLEGWLNSGKSADDVFGILKIREDGYNYLVDRKLETLREYINLYNAHNPQAKTNTFRTLTNGFGGDAEFALVIGRARQLPESETVYWEAFVFEQELFKKWMRDDLDPMSVRIKVFKTDESNLAGAPQDVKSIIAEYRAFFNRETGVLDHLPMDLIPRR